MAKCSRDSEELGTALDGHPGAGHTRAMAHLYSGPVASDTLCLSMAALNAARDSSISLSRGS